VIYYSGAIFQDTEATIGLKEQIERLTAFYTLGNQILSNLAVAPKILLSDRQEV